ncbi:MAG: hypothetical protein CME64_00615 [Halobacteriovoraceae bacterium]|nr:hypothetical protein [Halobacteriovoraceae bacterium]|tara:strand:- start:139572 stop:140978 length:1407 start_codon:yes stop_codon:yes gene_type:complete
MSDLEILLHVDEWGVKPKNDLEVLKYKGQERSTVDWENIDENTWLDFNKWKEQLKVKESTPDWKLKLKESQYSELVGRVIQCLNACRKYSKSGGSTAQYTSEIHEGDEISTGMHSYAWVFLRDGSIMRISPRTSISFLEVNLSEEKVFFLARLNHGHVYFEQRKIGKFPMVNKPETDMGMYPLLEKKANRSYFARKEYQDLTPKQRLLYTLEQNPGHVSQYLELNRSLERGKSAFLKRSTEFFIFTANATFLMQNPIFHLFHETSGETYVKLNESIDHLNLTDTRTTAGEVYFRGYNNKSFQKLPTQKWLTVDPEGLSIEDLENSELVRPVEYFVKRIPSIHLARERFLEKNSPFMFMESLDEKPLANLHGLRLWNNGKEELELRKKYLFERIRRVETTNLRSIKKVFKNSRQRGFTRDFYTEALSRTLMALKNLNNYNSQVVKETTETEYYLWILNNAEDFMPAYFR